MTDLVDRIARALCDHDNAVDAITAKREGLQPVALQYEDWRTEYDAAARAVMQALTDAERASLLLSSVGAPIDTSKLCESCKDRLAREGWCHGDPTIGCGRGAPHTGPPRSAPRTV